MFRRRAGNCREGKLGLPWWFTGKQKIHLTRGVFCFVFFFILHNIQLTPQKLSAGRKNHPGAPGAGVWPEDQKRHRGRRFFFWSWSTWPTHYCFQHITPSPPLRFENLKREHVALSSPKACKNQRRGVLFSFLSLSYHTTHTTRAELRAEKAAPAPKR